MQWLRLVTLEPVLFAIVNIYIMQSDLVLMYTSIPVYNRTILRILWHILMYL